MSSIAINTERYLLFGPDMHIGKGVKISKCVTDEQVENAIRLSCIRHPFLTATIRIDSDNRAYYEPGTSRPMIPEYAEVDEITDVLSFAKTWFEEQNRTPFDFNTGPLLRMSVARDRKSTAIFVIGHHILGDGLGYMNLMQDFLGFLDGNESVEVKIPPIIQGLSHLPKNTDLGFAVKTGIKLWNSQYKKNGRRYTLEDYYKAYHKMRARREPAMFFVELDEGQTSDVAENCKTNGLTVNDGLCAALWTARQEIGGYLRNLGLLISVRNELTPAATGCMGNFVSMYGVTDFDYDKSLSFWDNAKALKTKIEFGVKNQKKRYEALSLFYHLNDELIDAFNFYPIEENPHHVADKVAHLFFKEPLKGLGVTNLGRHALTYATFEVSNIWFAAPLTGVTDYSASLVTLNGRMSICIRYGAKETTDEAARTVFDHAVGLLTTKIETQE